VAKKITENLRLKEKPRGKENRGRLTRSSRRYGHPKSERRGTQRWEKRLEGKSIPLERKLLPVLGISTSLPAQCASDIVGRGDTPGKKGGDIKSSTLEGNLILGRIGNGGSSTKKGCFLTREKTRRANKFRLKR